MEKERIIMGIDPGTNILGYGVIRITSALPVRGARGKEDVQVVTMGVVDMTKLRDPYLRLGRIFASVSALLGDFLPDELAIEAPFYGKNVQSMLSLGRAQGVAISAAMLRDIPIHEYAPAQVKRALTGNGNASKEQVAGMLQRLFHLSSADMPRYMDATDALAVAYCHYLKSAVPVATDKPLTSWKAFVQKNSARVSTRKTKGKQ